MECCEACEILFQKLLEKLVNCKKIVLTIPDDAEMEYFWFCLKAMNFSALKKRKSASMFFYGDILEQKVNLVR